MCCQTKAFREEGIRIQAGILISATLVFFFRRDLNFSSMHYLDMAVVQQIFRILKLAQITWSFVGHISPLRKQ